MWLLFGFLALIFLLVLKGAPVPAARGTPAGIMLDDGYSTKIAFNANPTVSFWEKTVKPPGIDGGDGIDQTTMHNTTWRVMRSRALKTLTECTGTAGYDPNVVNQLNSLINVETTVTIHFPDGSTLAFFGYLKSIEFSDNTEGELPMINYSIVPTNFDPVGKVEAAPVLTSVPGT